MKEVEMETDTDTMSLRLFGLPEPDPREAEAFLSAELSGVSFENARTDDGEVEVTAHGVRTRATSDRIIDVFQKRHGWQLFSTDGRTVDELVVERLHGRRLVVVECNTAGRVRARLREASETAVWLGMDAQPMATLPFLLGVPRSVIADHGAASPQLAERVAHAALHRWEELGLDTAIAITDVVTTGDGDQARGLVSISGTRREGGFITCQQAFQPGPRDTTAQAVTLGMHILRVLLGPERLRVDGQVDT
jgi:nicotinamide-nucleotide amidase